MIFGCRIRLKNSIHFAIVNFLECVFMTIGVPFHFTLYTVDNDVRDKIYFVL